MYRPIIRTKNGSGGKLNIPILARLRKMKIGFFLFEDEKISGYQLAFFKGHDFIAKKKGHDFSCGFLVFVDHIMITMMVPHSKGTNWDQTFDLIIAESRTQ